jgi:hypothetical protein
LSTNKNFKKKKTASSFTFSSLALFFSHLFHLLCSIWKHFYSFLFLEKLFRKFEDFLKKIGSFDCKLEKLEKKSQNYQN